MVGFMKNQHFKEWMILCQNKNCKNKYILPEDAVVDWKTRKSFGLCKTSCDTVHPELKKGIPCPKCGRINFRVIKAYQKTKRVN